MVHRLTSTWGFIDWRRFRGLLGLYCVTIKGDYQANGGNIITS